MIELAAFFAADWFRSKSAGFGYGKAVEGFTAKQALKRKVGDGSSWLNKLRMGSIESGYTRQVEKGAFRQFFGLKGGGGFSERYGAARRSVHRNLLRSGVGKEAARGMLGRATGVALSSSIVGVGLSYMTWGMLPPMLTEMGIGGFNAIADIGRRQKMMGPNIRPQFIDTRQAATMRQAGLQAIHEAGMGGHRNVLGQEALLFHR